MTLHPTTIAAINGVLAEAGFAGAYEALAAENDRLRARDHHFAPLMEALANAQEVIHLSQCKLGDAGGNKVCWKECREATAALDAARREVGR